MSGLYWVLQRLFFFIFTLNKPGDLNLWLLCNIANYDNKMRKSHLSGQTLQLSGSQQALPSLRGLFQSFPLTH